MMEPVSNTLPTTAIAIMTPVLLEAWPATTVYYGECAWTRPREHATTKESSSFEDVLLTLLQAATMHAT